MLVPQPHPAEPVALQPWLPHGEHRGPRLALLQLRADSTAPASARGWVVHEHGCRASAWSSGSPPECSLL